VARFDKTEPHVGSYRAPLAANWPSGDVAIVVACGHDANGRVVKGAGNSGVKGVVALGKVRPAGHVIDIMTSGEIVDCVGLTAGTTYYMQDNGTISTVATGTYLGHTVEADRLIVRVAPPKSA